MSQPTSPAPDSAPFSSVGNAVVARSSYDRAGAAQVYFDGYCRYCRRSATWIRLLDRWRRLEPLSFRADDSYLRAGIAHEALEREMHVVSGSRVWHGFPAVVEIVRRLPLLWWSLPVLWLAGKFGWGARLYRWLADNRVLVSDGAACSIHGCSD